MHPNLEPGLVTHMFRIFRANTRRVSKVLFRSKLWLVDLWYTKRKMKIGSDDFPLHFFERDF